jgi:hypothetical protein
MDQSLSFFVPVTMYISRLDVVLVGRRYENFTQRFIILYAWIQGKEGDSKEESPGKGKTMPPANK